MEDSRTLLEPRGQRTVQNSFILCRTGLTTAREERRLLHPKEGTVPTPLWSNVDPLLSSVDA